MNFFGRPGATRFSLGGLFFLVLVGALQAGPLEELRGLSQLPLVDLEKLRQGEIVSERGPLGNFSRGISLESCYFVRAPIDVVGNALMHWDPTRHKDPDVRLYREYSFPGSAEVLQKLQLSSTFPDDRWLLEQSAKASAADSLHLTPNEAALLGKMPPSEAWREILRGRSEALTRGGMTVVPPYGADSSISPGSEYRGLLTLAPKAARHFRPITGAKPLVANGEPASEAVGYWEAARVRDHTTLQLGLFAARKSPESWQLLNCIYYPSDTYFMALDLFRLWPVEGGTLVWQVGLVSAPFRSYLGGVDRFVAGKQMTQETLETIRAFRASVEKRR